MYLNSLSAVQINFRALIAHWRICHWLYPLFLMLFSVHLTVILWAFLKVITGFFTIISLFNFQGPTHFQGCLLSSFEVANLSSARAIILHCFDFVKHFLKVFKKFFQLLKSKLSNTFDYFLNVDSPLPCVLHSFTVRVFSCLPRLSAQQLILYQHFFLL